MDKKIVTDNYRLLDLVMDMNNNDKIVIEKKDDKYFIIESSIKELVLL